MYSILSWDINIALQYRSDKVSLYFYGIATRIAILLAKIIANSIAIMIFAKILR